MNKIKTNNIQFNVQIEMNEVFIQTNKRETTNPEGVAGL
jgi:hypothetical protein